MHKYPKDWQKIAARARERAAGLCQRCGVGYGELQSIDAPTLFELERFKGVRNQWTNFSKYILMRIDRYLSFLLDKPSYTKENLAELEDRFNKNNLRRHGMHLEHVYTQHPDNWSLFTQDGVI